MSTALIALASDDASSAWEHHVLAEVADILDSKRIPVNGKAREDRSGSIPYYGATGRVGWIDEWIFDEELILLGEDGAPFLEPAKQKAYSIRGKSWVNNHAHVLRARAVPSAWLMHFLNTVDYRGLVTGTTRLKLTQAEMRKIVVPVASAAVMKAVVAEIEKQFSRLDQAVAGLQRVKAQLKRYKASVLKAAVEGRLVETEAERARREGRGFGTGTELAAQGSANAARGSRPGAALPYETGEQLLKRILETRRSQWKGKGKYKEPAAPETAGLPELPEGWCWSSTDQLAEVGTGATPNRSNATFFDGGDIPWVTSAVVNAPFVDKASELVTRAALLQTNLTEYPPGTLLVAMYGEGKTRGKCSELRITAATNQALAAVQADPSVRSYLKIFLEHNYEETRKVASGGVQPNLNLSLVRAIRVPLPPLREQHRIVAEVDRRLSIVREVEAEVDANLKRAQTLRQAVLARAFGNPHQDLSSASELPTPP